ncbi:MAG: hypothetical protein IJS59_03040 [Bacteroidaceae bacterium]|nr:hypothetical protein [Bacteroidaceae bacterium]
MSRHERLRRKLQLCACAMALAAGALTLAACGGDDGDNRPAPVEPAQPGRPGETLATTAIIYVAGENGLADFVDADSVEIARGLASIPADARVVMFIDDARSSRICVGTRSEPMQTVRTFPRNITATDSADMLGVMREIVGTYPAAHYGITFWSHASGWVEHDAATRARRRSFGIDNGQRDRYSNDGPEMSINTLAAVLEQLPHTDYLFFDACFMQCVEVAYELRHVTDWLIASPAEIPGDGAPYDIILADMCTPASVPTGIVQGYFDYYDTGKGNDVFPGVELSAIRTDKVEALAEATRPIVMHIWGGRREAATKGDDEFSDYDDADADYGVQRYCFRDNSDYYTEYFDMGSLIAHNTDSATYATWRKVCDEAVPIARLSPMWYTAISTPHFVNIDDVTHTVGVSMYAPEQRYDDGRQWNTAYHRCAWYSAAGLEQTGW